MIPTARGRARARCSPVVALLLAFFLGSSLQGRALGSSERDADADADADPPARGSGGAAEARAAAPARLLSSVFDADAGLRVDRYVKPLGALRPGEVLNTDPTSDAGALARPVSNETDPSPMLVARFSFDLVHGETLEPLPLDRLYNHHLVIFSRPERRGEKKKTKNKNASPRASGLAMPRGPDDPAASAAVAALAANLTAANLSAVLAPCGVGAFFAGGGAEWRGLRDRENARREEARLRNPRGDAAWFGGARAWIDPPAAAWGANVHAIDLRGVRSVRDSVQCNCAAYAERTPGTPQRRDHAPRRGGGIECCGDGARGPLRMGNDSLNDESLAPVALLYEIAWTPLRDALAFFASSADVRNAFSETTRTLRRGAPMTATLMVSSSPDLDGASCAGEYDARPCAGAFASEDSEAETTTEETTEATNASDGFASDSLVMKEARAWRSRADGDMKPPSPRDQKCAEVDPISGEKRNVSVATSHAFRLPPGAALDVSRMVGHQHVGGLGVRLLNVTDLLNVTKPDDDDDTEAVPYLDAPSVCVSLPRYGSTKGAPGDEAGFVVEMSECVFDPPLRVTHGEAFVVQSVYIADARNHTPAAFPPPYEGVMGYVTLTFTVAPGFEAGVFSRSGERRLLSAETVSENRNGTPSAFGTCVATPSERVSERVSSQSSIELAEDDAAPPEPDGHREALLTPEGSDPALRMAWRFVPGAAAGDSRVAITLTLTDTDTADTPEPPGPTWMALGVHRPGGHGMPGADMVVASSADGGATFAFEEMYTDAYDAPKPRRFYGDAVSVLRRSGCAVTVSSDAMGASQSVTFERLLVAPSDTVANITRGRATDVVWAFGEFGRARMAYHARRAGTATVSWS